MHDLIRGTVLAAENLSALHRRFERDLFPTWPETHRFKYDSLHTHVAHLPGLDELPARRAVLREVQRDAEMVEEARAAYTDAVTFIRTLSELAMDRMATGQVELSGSDIVRVFVTLAKIEAAERRDAAGWESATRFRRALDLFADVVGALATERLRGEIRSELRRREALGSGEALLAREAARRWNAKPPAEHELVDGVVAAS